MGRKNFSNKLLLLLDYFAINVSNSLGCKMQGVTIAKNIIASQQTQIEDEIN
ncbi:hypothetical protein IBE20_00560 [Francisella tularensis subsp. novicida]|uniref:hypothetical protein n=1 Tax=Francisella tularensis TaxID=263 RepID=UPI00017E2E4E|nr:hypothetical protein [Francisella tularensis]EDX27383.1 hypothetical protein FTE_1154 [Francisella tularensis subsp. novicida FTE]MBK2035040.1 hypothetical protein [Francisella tularensis subsp. novicida]MBK2035778.1 hypothetical protein [Francisella tularensis subsp. novicida]MBK2115742.1 hypothetical protein [Francisella tularensis subsp. novicida]MBK2311630.1 hypothetical protein [Francisella tularensis subsp. novicida]